MIELRRDRLEFSFPEVHPKASLAISFQRTLRVPDDGRTYPLPPGLGNFPIRHVDDYSHQVPSSWIDHGGVMMPMYQSEALWICFSASSVERRGTYPFCVRVLTGKVDAVTGEEYAQGLRMEPQNYLSIPGQPWLDGYCVGKGLVRQFVAMPLGEGYTAEEQITGHAQHGGLQLVVSPMKREAFERRFPEFDASIMEHSHRLRCSVSTRQCEMGLAPGGKIKQTIYKDPFDLDDWDVDRSSRCFVHIANSKQWRDITGCYPPFKPPTAAKYSKAGLPWFDYYDDNLDGVDSQEPLERLLSVNTLMRIWHGKKLDGNKSADPKLIVTKRNGLKPGQVRESEF